MLIADHASQFIERERPAANLLSADQVEALAVAATRFYAGYADFADADVMEISPATDLTDSEWAVIRPLFLLYVEREQAIQLEASRGLGVDVFGRSVSEVSGEIAQAEAELPHRAFYRPVVTV